MSNTDRMDELLTLAIRDLIRKEWEDMASADVSEVKKNPKFRRMQKKVTSMIRNGPQEGKKSYRSRRKRWLPALIAAGLLLLILAAPVVAAVIGNTTLGDILRRMGEDFFKLPYDTPTDIDGITVIRDGNVRIYAEIGDFLKEEGISLLWPTWLPEEVCVERIHVLENGEKYVYEFNRPDCSFAIYLIGDTVYDPGDAEKEIVRIGDMEVEVFFLYNAYIPIQVQFQYGEYEYMICVYEQEQAEHILDGLVEMKP